MLNFNVPHVKNSTGEPVWKVRDFILMRTISFFQALIGGNWREFLVNTEQWHILVVMHAYFIFI